MKLGAKAILRFRQTVLDYYRKHGRRFPWREPRLVGGHARQPYVVLVSEVMLQQTQAERVVPFFKKWMKRFPTVDALARAPLRKVLQAWSGLGYNRRALYLKRAAQLIVREHGGEVPHDLEKLNALPGIGRDTASAVLAFAWNEPTVFIETNIRTVYLHFFFKNRKKVRDDEILELVEQTFPSKESTYQRHSHILKNVRMSSREWYDALMDYGAMLKETVGNPNVRSAHYTGQKKFAGSRRELRGKVMQFFTRSERASVAKIRRAVQPVNHDLPPILNALVREGFLKKEGKRFTLA